MRKCLRLKKENAVFKNSATDFMSFNLEKI